MWLKWFWYLSSLFFCFYHIGGSPVVALHVTNSMPLNNVNAMLFRE